ncbi:redoxin family protein [Streptobacillus felis]|uniref:redoxin family protein n=1 Tax=Streptobacillus felis TaxID=1384509 RepID=UPI0008317679|nr:redoxin family protein [Streptobacillus felis]
MKKIIIMLMLIFSSLTFSGDLDNIVFKDQKGQVKTIKDFKGKTYIKLWASWCPTCLYTMDHTVELSKEKNLGFNVISVVSPTKKGELNEEDFKKWFKGTDWTALPVLMDNQGSLIKKARLRGYPTNVFIDSEGNIAKVVTGVISTKKIKEEMSKIK